MPITSQHSGIVLSQNYSSGEFLSPLTEDELIYPAPSLYPSTTLYPLSLGLNQTFSLPGDYQRGEMIPSLTGFQVYIGVTSTDCSLTWTLDYYEPGAGWLSITDGESTGTPVEGDEVWHTVYFDAPVTITENLLDKRFRFGIADEAEVSRFWFGQPNPLVSEGDKAHFGIAPVLIDGEPISLMFRILADTADSGRDFLGNLYRSAVIHNEIDTTSTVSGDRDSFYLSAPQPSKFAVVSHYFDMRDTNLDAVVVDGVLLDPTTPGVYFNVYYSNDDEPGTDTETWDNLLWTPVPQTYHLVSRTNFFFPTPVAAKYVKIEYSHLQAKYYSPGNFQKPITYKKHPKWVTDYYLARSLARNTEDPLIARRVQVIYDALDFAYTYYRDDLSTSPTIPDFNADILPALRAEDAAFNVDSETLAKIRIAFKPYLDQPGLTGRSDYILGRYLTTQAVTDYPVEQINRARSSVSEVSSLEREAVIAEKDYPVMSFYVTCRHGYRVSEALFDNDRAYFVGINEIAFTRERYDSRSDTDVYIESTGDLVNVERNDFESVNFEWKTFDVS